MRICVLVGVAFAVGCSGGEGAAQKQSLTPPGSGGDGSGAEVTSAGGSESVATGGGAGGTESGDGGSGSKLGVGLGGNLNAAGSDDGSGGSGLGQQLTSTSGTATSSVGGATGSGGAGSTVTTTGNQACECEAGDPCCDGCSIVADGCTDAADAACSSTLDASAIFTCGREEWEAQSREWRCPSNLGDDGDGLGCPDLGPLAELVGDHGLLGDEPVTYTIKVDCRGSDRSEMRACINFANDEFDQCSVCE
jgi:hypothetical protein